MVHRGADARGRVPSLSLHAVLLVAHPHIAVVAANTSHRDLLSAGAPRPDVDLLSHLRPAQPGVDAPLPQRLPAMYRGRNATTDGNVAGRGGAAEELDRGSTSHLDHPVDGDVPGGRSCLLGFNVGSTSEAPLPAVVRSLVSHRRSAQADGGSQDGTGSDRGVSCGRGASTSFAPSWRRSSASTEDAQLAFGCGSQGGNGGDGGGNNSTVVAAAAASSDLLKLSQRAYERRLRARHHTRKSRDKSKTEIHSLQVDVSTLPGGADLVTTAMARADVAKTKIMRSWSNRLATTEEAADGPSGETKGACEMRLKHSISAIDKRLRGVRPDVMRFKVRLKRLQNQRSGFGAREYQSALARELNEALGRGPPPSLINQAPPGSPSSGAMATTAGVANGSCLASGSTMRDAAMLGRDSNAVVDTHAALGGDDAHPPNSANARDAATAVIVNNQAWALMVYQGMEVAGAGNSLVDDLPAYASLSAGAVAGHPAEAVLGWTLPVPDGAVVLGTTSCPPRSVTPAVAPGTLDDQVQPFGVDTRVDQMKELDVGIERLFMGCSISPSGSMSALEQLDEAAGVGGAGVTSTDCEISPVSSAQGLADEHVTAGDDGGSDGDDSSTLPYWKAMLGDLKTSSREEMVDTIAVLQRPSLCHPFSSSLPSSPSRFPPLFSSSSTPAVSGRNEVPAGRTPGSSADAVPGQPVGPSLAARSSPSRAATSPTVAMDLDGNGDGGSAGGNTSIRHQEEESPYGSPADWMLVTDGPSGQSVTSPTRARVGWWTRQAADDALDTGAAVPAAPPQWPSDMSAHVTTPAA